MTPYQKQILPVSIYTRIASTTIDFFLFSVLYNLLLNKFFIFLLENLLSQSAPDNSILNQLESKLTSTETLHSSLEKLSHMKNFAAFIILSNLINIFFLGLYFCFFWTKFGSTPGKMLLSIKIIDQNNINKNPSISQSIKRFLGYFVSMLEILVKILFRSPNSPMFHDKISKTRVIKK
ncbi:MAG: RDD family protein [Rickettsia sp.]|nr:RDD family protein [Rickettsia sp.]